MRFFILLLLLLSCSSQKEKPLTKGWTLIFNESFQTLNLFTMNWDKNYLFEKDKYSDDGEYFHKQHKNFHQPWGWRGHTTFGDEAWLELHAYSRNPVAKKFYEVVNDPHTPRDSKRLGNKVLRLMTPVHTDGILLRSKNTLPPQYRICVDVGYAQYGSGKTSDHNGYTKIDKNTKETAAPWLKMDATKENGFYWLAILDDEPKPRNNVWIHHHRKVVVNSDNNTEAWTKIFNGKEYIKSGEHPVMMFAVKNETAENKKYVHNFDRTGYPFISWANQAWHDETQTKEIRAVDAYLYNEWYHTCIEKTLEHYRFTVSGNFKYGGIKTYDSIIGRSLVYKGDGNREYFMLGDPHINFYEGLMYVDNVTLEIPKI